MTRRDDHLSDDYRADFAEVWYAELSEVCPELLRPEPATLESLTAAVDDGSSELSALCLSGGGIRSAIFSLGVIQALARVRLLGQFHYLSTVSGGGYIGSWLSAWRSLQSDEAVFEQLNYLGGKGADPEQIRGLRADSNYITPRLGVLSADTWTVIALYVRNLLLNWLLFAPFFIGCLLLPYWWNAVLRWLKGSGAAAHYGLLSAGSLLLLFGLSFGVYGRFRRKDHWLSRGRFIKLVLIPLVASGTCYCAASQAVVKPPVTYPCLLGAGIGAAVYFLAWLFGRVIAHPSEDRIDPPEVIAWTLSGCLVGAIVALGMISAPPAGGASSVAVFGISWCVLAYLAGDIIYVGTASFGIHGDMDREWLARAAGWLAGVAVLWAIVASVALWGPLALHAWAPKAGLFAVGGASGLAAVVLGWSEKTGATMAAQAMKKLSLIQVASGAAVVFALILAVLLAYSGQSLVHRFGLWASPDGFPLVETGVMIGLILIAFVISFFVNVNRFSLHALYRNRLARAFIGSARWGYRNPDPFTGFATKDSMCLATVRPHSGPNRLFHIINATLNVVSPENLAWQERKAESFTLTRLHCGNPRVCYRNTKGYATGRGEGGITLATAMAISGAAVSPNQGYNSSPLVAFLLMLFNVRLGWWLGNPKGRRYACEGPDFGITPALKELTGDTTDKGRWIYLSDGGHFENLGLYEAVRRRCRFIVAVDAGCDPHFTFEDLGNAVRKIFIDMGVGIDFRHFELEPRQDPPISGARCAIGTITYPGSDRRGWILYMKPTYQATEGMDIRSYASVHPSFPDQSTVDQWFSESQFESYRALGAFIAQDILTVGGTHSREHMSLDDLKAAAEAYAASQREVSRNRARSRRHASK